MAYGKGNTEGGQGGKVGHSNMSHRDYTEWIKVCSTKNRRLQSRQLSGNIVLEDTEVEITLTLSEDLDEIDKDKFNVQFIEEMEKRQLLFGGSLKKSTLSGCIDRSSSNLSETELIELMDDLCTNTFVQVVEMKIKTATSTT